jgi:hypothetical protein
VTRLPYHRFGLLDTGSAAAILTGCKVGELALISPLQLYTIYSNDYKIWNEDKRQYRHSRTVMFLVIHLVELIRPVVEGFLSQDYLSHDIAKECDALKTLPLLGAQIIRCIGRAYRYTGQRYLRRYKTSFNRITCSRKLNELWDKFSFSNSDN